MENPTSGSYGYEEPPYQPSQQPEQPQQQLELSREAMDSAVAQVVSAAEERVVGSLSGVAQNVMAGVGDLAQRAGAFQGEVQRAETHIKDVALDEGRYFSSRAGEIAENTAANLATVAATAVDSLDAKATQVKNDIARTTHDALSLVDDAVEKADNATDRAADRATAIIQAMRDGQFRVVRDAVQELLNEQDPGIQRIKRELEASTSPQHEHMPLLRTAVQAGVPVWLHGEAGSGKSTAARIVSDELGLPFRSKVFGPTTSEAALMGYRDAHGHYHGTGFREIVEKGGVFLLDEIDNTNPGVVTAMNGVLANGEGEFPDQLVKNHHDTRFIAAANTVGRGATAQYVGRNPLDGATIDRFAFLPWNVDWGLTEALMSGRESSTTTPARIMQDERDRITPSDWLLKVRAYSEASQRLGIKHLVTPRAALLGRKLIEAGMGEYWSTEMLLHKGLNDDNRRKLERAVSGSGAV